MKCTLKMRNRYAKQLLILYYGLRSYAYWLEIDTYGLLLTVFELFDWLKKRVRPPARPSDTNTIAAKLSLRRATRRCAGVSQRNSEL